MNNIPNIITDLGIENPLVVDQLTTLFKSIQEVKKENMWFYVENDPSYKCIEQVERTFTYELYRQWKNKLQDTPDYTINAEIQKKISDDIKNSLFEKETNLEIVYPDFVLHKSQSNFEKKRQLLICEVKRSDKNKEGVIKDFRTFEKMMNNNKLDVPYAFAVFIMVCSDFKVIKDNVKEIQSIFSSSENYIHEIIDSSQISILDRIICLCYDPDKAPSIVAKTLNQIYNPKHEN